MRQCVKFLLEDKSSQNFIPRENPYVIRRTESLGFLYGRGREYVIGKRIHCSAQPEQRVCGHVAVVNLCALPADCTDLMLKVEPAFCFGYRVESSFRKYHPFVPLNCSFDFLIPNIFCSLAHCFHVVHGDKSADGTIVRISDILWTEQK